MGGPPAAAVVLAIRNKFVSHHARSNESLFTRLAAAAAEFYRGLLGWKMEDMLPPNSPGQYPAGWHPGVVS